MGARRSRRAAAREHGAAPAGRGQAAARAQGRSRRPACWKPWLGLPLRRRRAAGDFQEGSWFSLATSGGGSRAPGGFQQTKRRRTTM